MVWGFPEYLGAGEGKKNVLSLNLGGYGGVDFFFLSRHGENFKSQWITLSAIDKSRFLTGPQTVHQAFFQPEYLKEKTLYMFILNPLSLTLPTGE